MCSFCCVDLLCYVVLDCLVGVYFVEYGEDVCVEYLL